MKLIDVNVLKEWVENWFTKNRFYHPYAKNNNIPITELYDILEQMPSAQPERKWTPCSNPPKHHGDVLVRGNEAIGNVTVHKVMQWDVDRWRPMDYAPSIIWEEWSEI